jgi:hypothetical protein
MPYSLIEPPSSRTARERTRKEAKAYFDWFVAQIPERISLLEKLVRSSAAPQYQTWAATRLPDSLDVLGRWLAEHIEIVPLSAEQRQTFMEQLQAIPEQYREIFDAPSFVFSDATNSLIVDIGMYLGEVLRSRLPHLDWQLSTKHKKDVHYQEPVLAGFRKGITSNPVALVSSFAGGLANNKYQPARLREIFDNWVYRETAGVAG